MYVLLIAIVAIVLAFAALVYIGHLAIVYHRFNDGIKDWANSLDVSTKDAINRSAREILRELDQKISDAHANENVEPLNVDINE